MAPKKQKKPPTARVSSPVPTLRKKKLRAARTDCAGRTWWSDEERLSLLAALNANGGDVPKTARETGVSYYTLRAWSVGARCPEALQLSQDKNHKLADACEELAWLFAAHVPRKVDKAPLNHLTAGIGIMVEKMKLLRGEPTNYGRTDNTNRNVSVNLERLPPDERPAFLRALALVTGRLDVGDGDDTDTAGRGVETQRTRDKVAGVLGSGVPDR
jgi:transposase-like protein